MSFIFYNPNPEHRFVGDCTIRAICRLLDMDWDTAYANTVFQGFIRKDMPSGNKTWGQLLLKKGYKRYFIPDEYLYRYTVQDFCIDHPIGRYLLVLDEHVVTVVDGNYYDTWDSGRENPIYYWTKGE